ncbi:hypothetical protein ES703_102609 [subsurface metagenome]
MKMPVDYIDTAGNHQNLNYHLSRLAFTKHLSIAGQGYSPRMRKVLRTLGMFFHYSYYLQRQSFYNNHFSTPPNLLSDPTEKGQFSNLAGKAIADFLSKRIGKSFLTVNYEAAMRALNKSIIGKRPDLIAFSNTSVFAIEAKGYTGGPGNMMTHKSQSKANPLGVNLNYTVACVSFNLYNSIQCNYHALIMKMFFMTMNY